MTDFCFDTGIIIDTLSGHRLAVAELRRARTLRAISTVVNGAPGDTSWSSAQVPRHAEVVSGFPAQSHRGNQRVGLGRMRF